MRGQAARSRPEGAAAAGAADRMSAELSARTGWTAATDPRQGARAAVQAANQAAVTKATAMIAAECWAEPAGELPKAAAEEAAATPPSPAAGAATTAGAPALWDKRWRSGRHRAAPEGGTGSWKPRPAPPEWSGRSGLPLQSDFAKKHSCDTFAAKPVCFHSHRDGLDSKYPPGWETPLSTFGFAEGRSSRQLRILAGSRIRSIGRGQRPWPTEVGLYGFFFNVSPLRSRVGALRFCCSAASFFSAARFSSTSLGCISASRSFFSRTSRSATSSVRR